MAVEIVSHDLSDLNDLDAFLNRADELAEDLLSEGITAMKIWPFDPFAAATGSNGLVPANPARTLFAAQVLGRNW